MKFKEEEKEEDLDEVELDEGELICPNCGQSTEGATTCPYCGAILAEEEDELDDPGEEEGY